MHPFFRRFGVRVTFAIICSMLAVVVLSVLFVYQMALQSQFESIRTNLKSIAKTATQVINAEYVSQIPLTPEGINTQAYAFVSDQLRRIKAGNEQIEDIYILTKTDSTNIWKFVVDPDVAWRGVQSSPGKTYDAGRFKQLLNAFDMPTADHRIEVDEWGKTVSGYAPIRDAIGRPIAVLGVDMNADQIYAMQHQVWVMAMIVFGAGILMAIIIGALISNRVVGPVNDLIAGTRYIAEGHLHYQTAVRGHDEISELAASFNNMAQSLEDSRRQLVNYFYDTVKSLVLILEIRDHYTLGHSESVANYSEKIAKRMGINGKTLDLFKRVVLLHDIGKIGVRDSVLLKPDRLDEQEWEVIKLHPVMGEQILKPILNDPVMLAIIRNHHERQDGKGYPDGLTKDQIPLLVAIVTVADSYDAMTSTRAYRRAMSKEQAIEQLKQHSGTQFHPDVVDAFLQVLEEDKNERPNPNGGV